jgi:hypothetical protein
MLARRLLQSLKSVIFSAMFTANLTNAAGVQPSHGRGQVLPYTIPSGTSMAIPKIFSKEKPATNLLVPAMFAVQLI